MTKTFRARCFRPITISPSAFLLLLVLVPALTGCKKDQTLFFCEGVTKEGEKIKCGTQFTTGDLTGVIQAKEPFAAKKLTVSIIETVKNRKEPVRTFSATVKPEETTAHVQLSFYTEGKFQVRITGKDKAVVAEGDIEIIDTY